MARKKKTPAVVHRWLRFLRRENLHRILAVLGVLLVLGALALWHLEPQMPFADWLWWSIVTMTTVGYGDITPQTLAGRAIGVVLMFFGIGILSMLTATIASVFVEQKLLKERGMGKTKLSDHIILCTWNHRAREILAELRADQRTAAAPIVLIADLDSKPVDDDELYFVSGVVNEETLDRAGINTAQTVVVLGDDELEAHARDAQVVLATLTVESLNPDAYTIVEVVDEANVAHCRRARADEVIVGHQLSSRMIASSAIDHGLSKVVSEILSQRYGNDLRKMKPGEEHLGQSFFDVFCQLKKANNAIAVAVQRGGEVVTNPSAAWRVELGDELIVIAERPA